MNLPSSRSKRSNTPLSPHQAMNPHDYALPKARQKPTGHWPTYKRRWKRPAIGRRFCPDCTVAAPGPPTYVDIQPVNRKK